MGRKEKEGINPGKRKGRKKKGRRKVIYARLKKKRTMSPTPMGKRKEGGPLHFITILREGGGKGEGRSSSTAAIT